MSKPQTSNQHFTGQTKLKGYTLKPPKEVGGNKFWKLQTTVYGLADNSRIWYLTLQGTLLKAGARKSKFDEEVFFVL